MQTFNLINGEAIMNVFRKCRPKKCLKLSACSRLYRTQNGRKAFLKSYTVKIMLFFHIANKSPASYRLILVRANYYTDKSSRTPRVAPGACSPLMIQSHKGPTSRQDFYNHSRFRNPENENQKLLKKQFKI